MDMANSTLRAESVKKIKEGKGKKGPVGASKHTKGARRRAKNQMKERENIGGDS